MGTLHVVATPIGNLEDVTLRALRVLAEAKQIFAEDTRRTRVLLDRHAIAARPLSLHAHNEQSRIEAALALLARDLPIALVSDAGTPLVSDPGERLVRAAVEAGHRVEAVPGPSAVLAALTISGLPAQPFTFAGFPPRRAGERRSFLEQYRDRAETLVLFESPHRLAKTLNELAATFGGERRACVAREITKLHEEARRGTLLELAEAYAEGTLGEVTIVVEGWDGSAATAAEASSEVDGDEDATLDDRILKLLEEGQRPRQVAAVIARETSVPRRSPALAACSARCATSVPRSSSRRRGTSSQECLRPSPLAALRRRSRCREATQPARSRRSCPRRVSTRSSRKALR
jgi:16S rRNA (cytidine1402-2'-O)-methyltransferase